MWTPADIMGTFLGITFLLIVVCVGWSVAKESNKYNEDE